MDTLRLSNWDYSKRFKSFAEVWPQGPEALLAELSEIGCQPQYSSHLKQNLAAFEKVFPSLTQARSHKGGAPAAHSFTYAMGLAKLESPQKWSLIFADAKIAQSPEFSTANVIVAKAPDAAVDYILKKIAPPEWHALAGDSSGPALQTRFPGVHFENPVTNVIGPFVNIGAGCIVETGVRIGARVSIGENCRLGANTRISDDVSVGKNAQFTASVSLGGQGFGYIKYPKAKSNQQRKHVGCVRIGDNVRLGAFVGVDRGVFEDTTIGHGTGTDAMVQIGHNCEVGEDNRICGFVGLAGSTEVGNNVIISGLTATKGHIKIGDNVVIAGQTGVTSDVASGEQVKGYPQRPIKEALKISILQGRLPEFLERIRRLEAAIFKKDS